jgi:hypothetical protein
MSAPISPHLQPALIGRLRWRPAVVLVAALLAVIAMAGIFNPAPANAAVASVAQCNGQLAGPGATTVMNCDVTVINTINHGLRSAVVTTSAICANSPCVGGTSSQSFSDVVTSIAQCNDSDNDAAHPINCNVSVTNFISADTPGAQPVTAATVNQCVGSGSIGCTPFPATTTNATVTQCNGSGNGGGGAVNCTVPASTISPAIPIMINQCNGTGNPGGSVVTCSARLNTYITGAAVTPTATPTTTTPSSPAPTAAGSTAPAVLGTPVTPGDSGTSGSTDTSGTSGTFGTTGTSGTSGIESTPQVAIVPTGAVATGGGSTAGLQHVLLLTVSIGLLFAAGCSALLRRRFVRGS